LARLLLSRSGRIVARPGLIGPAPSQPFRPHRRQAGPDRFEYSLTGSTPAVIGGDRAGSNAYVAHRETRQLELTAMTDRLRDTDTVAEPVV
jgi:hypothetical protein